MRQLLRDVGLGFRLFRRGPGLAWTATGTLALGIGATTTLFSIVYAVILNPLPFPGSRDLVQLWRSELPALTYGSASYARYLDWRAAQQPFTDLGAWAPRGMTLAGDQLPGGSADQRFAPQRQCEHEQRQQQGPLELQTVQHMEQALGE